MKYEYFRFSKWVPSPTQLKAWCEWFTYRKIPWAIVKAGSYALFRKGTEATDPGRKQGANSELITGEITQSWKWDS